ncbi:HK97 family phage prohead protease [Bradyrhizobium sp. AUGA SZCCT0182]|uniref:HK97 family phage prohead protease n=1 Tax=Bradyrhizobium sp. AUGA SZCCT0182 TaxID=2807667 RepID=UPI001BA81E1C|nr:HK97 family phage prohead protease [Bradyrhizobium sp. AUGA SZCCT0182]MBR1232583.1 HK97 family phage prohead protease [Bradyrhizobium sp. AUGA SZCCT0182]
MSDSATGREKFRQIIHGRKNGNRVFWNNPEHIDLIAKRCGIIKGDYKAALRSTPQRTVLRSTTILEANGQPDGTGIGTTQGKDRADDRVLGINTAEFEKNPILCFSHLSGELPVGRVTALWRSGDALRFAYKLAPASANPIADHVRESINGGYLRGVSIGFIPRSFKFSEDSSRPYGIDFLETELIELSICPLPCNPACLLDPVPVAIGGGGGGKAIAANVVSNERVERMRREIERLRARS